MLSLDPFVFCMNTYPGLDTEAALEFAKSFGFRRVELAAIDGICEQIDADSYSRAYVDGVAEALAKRGLECYALSGHGDMTDDAAFRRLLVKIRIAGELGARCVNTRCGPKARYPLFLEHVKQAAELAGRYGMALNLESYGDIVGPACEAAPVFAELGLANVHYNYDPGNTFRFKRGKIVIADDLANAQIVPSYLHLKDGGIRDGVLWNTPVGAGDINFPAVFRALEQKTARIPAGLEVPLVFAVKLDDLSMRRLPATAEAAREAVAESLAFLRAQAELRF